MKEAKNSNYRKYYKEYYGIEFGKDMEVHHMDENKDNNEIYNLLLLPKDVHKAIHNSKYQYALHTSSEYFQDGLYWVGIKYYDFLDNSIEYLKAIREGFRWYHAKINGYKNLNDSRVTLK